MMQQMLVGLGGGGAAGSATGGIVHYDPGTGKTYHVFLVGKHKLTVGADISNAELLVVGGGGGGGAHHGGGGGAGGALHHTSLNLPAAEYIVDIGKGGAGALHGYGPALMERYLWRKWARFIFRTPIFSTRIYCLWWGWCISIRKKWW